jgi:hypothetical protein
MHGNRNTTHFNCKTQNILYIHFQPALCGAKKNKKDVWLSNETQLYNTILLDGLYVTPNPYVFQQVLKLRSDANGQINVTRGRGNIKNLFYCREIHFSLSRILTENVLRRGMTRVYSLQSY